MPVGSYDIDYYPDATASAASATKVAAHIARHTGNPVKVLSCPPSSETPDPKNFIVTTASSEQEIIGLMQSLLDPDP